MDSEFVLRDVEGLGERILIICPARTTVSSFKETVLNNPYLLPVWWGEKRGLLSFLPEQSLAAFSHHRVL